MKTTYTALSIAYLGNQKPWACGHTHKTYDAADRCLRKSEHPFVVAELQDGKAYRIDGSELEFAAKPETWKDRVRTWKSR